VTKIYSYSNQLLQSAFKCNAGAKKQQDQQSHGNS